MVRRHKRTLQLMICLSALLTPAFAVSANPANHPFKAPPVTNATPLTVVVLRDTTEKAPFFKSKNSITQQQEATEKLARPTRARRSRKRSRARRKTVDRSWTDQVLQNN